MCTLIHVESKELSVESQTIKHPVADSAVQDHAKTEINERKPIEYCARSNRVDAGIFEQSPSRAAQNDGVLHAECGTPTHGAKRKSQRRNNFHGYLAPTPRAKLKKPRAPHHCAPRAPNHTRKTPGGSVRLTPLPRKMRPSAMAAIRRNQPPAVPSVLAPPATAQVPPASQESASSG
jgi:hypothetical protein